jgi:hypothetical protein
VNGATLLVSIDPSEWFANVDFTGLAQVSATPPAYLFPDDNVSSASQSLFAGLTSGNGTFSFTFQ